MAKERVEQVRKKYENERDQMIKDLQNRVEKVLKLEMENDEIKDAYRQLEQSLSRDEQQYKLLAQRKAKNIEQITQMYHQKVSEISVMKVDLSMAENKLKKRDDKIVELEKIVVQLREKV